MIYTISDLQNVIAPIAKKYQIPAIYLFGSYAKGIATESSDIDLLIDTTGTALTNLLSIGALHCELEDTLQKPIDLITMSSVQQKAQMPSEQDFRETVLNEMVKLYGVT